MTQIAMNWRSHFISMVRFDYDVFVDLIGSSQFYLKEIVMMKEIQYMQFDPTNMLIPEKSKKTLDFNLLDTIDPKQLDVIYESLKVNNNDKDKMAEFIANDTTVQVMYNMNNLYPFYIHFDDKLNI